MFELFFFVFLLSCFLFFFSFFFFLCEIELGWVLAGLGWARLVQGRFKGGRQAGVMYGCVHVHVCTVCTEGVFFFQFLVWFCFKHPALT